MLAMGLATDIFSVSSIRRLGEVELMVNSQSFPEFV
jgi:hypothetical protein